jgi:hypothetical protein
MNCTSKGAYHKSTLPWGYEDAIVKMLPASEAPIVSTVSNDNCLVGTFQSNSTPTTYYVIVVNKSLSRITNITVSLKHNYSGKITKAPSVINYNGSTTWTSVSGTTSFSIYDLYGGEGQFYKFTNITNPY